MAGLQFDRERRGVSGEALQFGQSALIKNEVQADLFYEFSERMGLTIAYQFEDINNFQGSSGVDAQNHLVTLQTTFNF